ncbi:uncharacterized protein LY89DRAFT_635727 [Mollisia scopiformis]|uniref:CREG-like beta-barrel domain-containing protein n=1 Tax=Mollisia scopiformis TaxID=149040 RepID=A0A194XTG4_MOLSC|nr:uncharacterized protein LY89DRAFT_635727 [Mollisia scopiformis]KUJ23431.1 hypothetical protein LY89DRAFT_635727 [Mollisia scopiformis]
MRFSFLTTLLPLATASSLPTTKADQQPQHIFSNPSSLHESTYRIPTSYESAVLARRILALTPLGTLSTVFPSSSSSNPHESENRPSGLGGLPIGLTDYISDCEGTGDPTILAINIATSFKNAAAGSNISVSLQWVPPYPPKSRIGSFTLPSLFSWFEKADEDKKGALPFSAANLPRFSLLGYLEKIDEGVIHNLELAKCFVSTHKDAKFWLPGNPIHTSEWVRLVVQDVYWIGGFGDRAYIGWIPVEEWRNVTTKEWESVRLPGEKKGWKEWSADAQWEL